MLKSRTSLIITTYLSLPAFLLLFVSCNNNAANDYSRKEQILQESIRMKDMKIAALEDSLQKAGKNLHATDSLVQGDPVSSAGTAEISLYKKGSKNGIRIPEKEKKYPGEFPEGSARILTEKDLKFLSEWGLKVMLNEIYARHGMLFTDAQLQNHFNRTKWYKGTHQNIDHNLSKTERQNLIFIRNYKYKPEIPT